MKGADVEPVYRESNNLILEKFPQYKGVKLDKWESGKNPNIVNDFKNNYKETLIARAKAKKSTLSDDDIEYLMADLDGNSNAFNSFIDNINAANSKPKLDSYATKEKYLTQIEANPLWKDGYNEWTTNIYQGLQPKGKMFNGFTPSGNKRFLDATPENVVKKMKGNINNGEGMHYGLGSYRATLTPRMKSVDEMRGLKNSLISHDEMVTVKNQLEREFDNIYGFLEGYEKYPDSYVSQSDTMERLGEIFKGKSKWSDYYKDVPDDLKADIADFNKKLVASPSEYFEGKPQRMVSIGEFKAALVPENIDQRTIDILNQHGITDIKKYIDKVDKQKKLSEFDQLLFNRLLPIPAGLLGIGAMRDKDTN